MPVTVEHLACLARVEDARFCHCEADPHGDATEYLIVVGQAVHDPAAIVGSHEAQDLHLSCLRIYLDLAKLCSKRVGDFVRGIRSAVSDAYNYSLFFESRDATDFYSFRSIRSGHNFLATDHKAGHVRLQILSRHLQ